MRKRFVVTLLFILLLSVASLAVLISALLGKLLFELVIAMLPNFTPAFFGVAIGIGIVVFLLPKDIIDRWIDDF